MKKREFLAMSGAAPLVLAGCGGKGAGNAPVRLVNASVGYSALGFMVNGVQAVSGVTYGSVSAFESVDAGTQNTSLTLPGGSALATVTRSYSKDQHYSLVAYGYVGELRQILITESTSTPDSGYASITVMNTSLDIGAVDVYLATDLNNLSTYSLIASKIGASTTGAAQSTQPNAFFLSTTASANAFYVVVVGAGANVNTTTDFRLKSSATITLANQQTYTLILTPGASGTLANAIFLQQGTSGTTQNLQNGSARVRAFVSLGSNSGPVTVTGVVPTAAVSPFQAAYAVVNQGTPPAVTVNGSTVTAVTVTGNPTNATANTLVAGCDYTLLVYLVGTTPTAQFILDDNTAPASSTDIKVRLINLVYDTNGNSTYLSMSVNGYIVNNPTYATASGYLSLPVSQQTNSNVEVSSSAGQLVNRTQLQLSQGATYTEVVIGVSPVPDFFAVSANSSITSSNTSS